jgi:hypothetical protein
MQQSTSGAIKPFAHVSVLTARALVTGVFLTPNVSRESALNLV